jgi:hypothetical protein
MLLDLATNHTNTPNATRSKITVILLIIIRKTVAGLQTTAILFILVLGALVYPEKAIPKNISTATEIGSKTPSAKKLKPRRKMAEIIIEDPSIGNVIDKE